MELRHLDAVLAVAEEGSFTAAADLLATVQSNVSEQVRQLEAELGAELFVRSRRGARPTDRGEVVLERACGVSSKRCAPTSRCCRGSKWATPASASSEPRAAGSCPSSWLICVRARRACTYASWRPRRSASSPRC